MSDRSALLPPHYLDELLDVARRGGLTEVGACTAAPFDAARAALEQRKQAGLHGGMGFTYRNPERSTDPRHAVTGAQSLIVGALAYRRRSRPSRPEPQLAGAVGAFAWHDYYARLRAAFAPVVDRLRADGHRALVTTDDNLLVDRAAAVRAGLGWFGKNANVLLPRRGSWFVLGAVVTDAPLVGDDPSPVPDGCGGCRRCLDHCPTGAIVAPGVVDARRCLAWHLQSSEFPPEYREVLGNRFYGCDDCQVACPPNQRLEGTVADLEPGGLDHVDVLDVLSAADETLERQFARLYFADRDVDQLRRNALIVLGNSGVSPNPAVAQVLSRYVGHQKTELRSHAIWAARRLGLGRLIPSTTEGGTATQQEPVR